MASIKHFTPKIKATLKGAEKSEILTATIIILVAFASFGLGRLSVGEVGQNEPVQIVYPGAGGTSKIATTPTIGNTEVTGQTANAATQEGLLVASKNSDKYHYPWCAGAARINEANKIFFASKEEAEKAGYKPASNCPGL